ncbi:MAG: retropepsin-like aspartic protease [Sphingomonadaceae bacterium]
MNRSWLPALMFLCLAGVSVPVRAQTAPAPASPADAATDVATGVDQALRLTVPVMINGQGPFQFVIDTGADRTVVSTEVADRLGLPSAGKARLHSLGGARDVRIVKVDTVQVSTNIVKNVNAAALPAENLGADGLLGIDSLKGQRVVIDFAASSMKVVPSSEAEDAVPDDASLIVVTARTRLGQLVMVDADANAQKIWVVVDTGSQNSVANTRLRTLLTRRAPKLDIKQISMVDVLGKITPADYVLVNRLRIGGVALGNAPIAFADVHTFSLFGLSKKPSMLLGVETLRIFRRVSIDFSSRKVKFLLTKDP